MMKLTAEIHGRDCMDLVSFLEEIIRCIDRDCTSGSNKSEAGNFHFSVDGEPERVGGFSG